MSTFRFHAALGFLLAAVASAAAESPVDVRRQIVELRAELARLDTAYHRDATSEIGDHDYDQLKRRLVALEQQYPAEASRAGPRLEIGDDRSGLFQTRRHRERMLSLDKVYTQADLLAFHARVARTLGRKDVAYVVEPKFDGLAVSVTFENGKLVRAVTRGNGREGDDVTANVRRIAMLPPALRVVVPDGRVQPIPTLIEARAEVFVPFGEFARVNAEREAAGEPRFATPRNLAAGTLRQLDAQEVARRGLRIVFFGLGACEPLSAAPATQQELHARFAAWGLPAIVESWRANTADELVTAVEACSQARPAFAFPTDGAVVKVDSLALQRELGLGESTPHWAVAFKFPPDRAETQVLAITIQVGRTGALTPVAELAPVELGGTTVSRATLHNRDEIARKDIRVGDRVVIEKAGEIIPAIVAVRPEHRPATAEPFVFPTSCPECGVAVSERKGEAVVRCISASCPAQLRRRLEHFASRACVDITGLGPAMIETLVERGLIEDLPDIYRLRRDDVLALGRNTQKSTDQLFAAIEISKRAELWRFIHGIGIPQVGASASRDLARRFASLEELVAVADSSVTAKANDSALRVVAMFFADAKNRALVAELTAAGVRPSVSARGTVAAKPGIAGRTFVLTGTLQSLTRSQATQKIEAAGGRVAAGVSRSTQFLVVGADAGAKLEQAKTLGVPIIDEAALIRMLAEDGP